MCIKTTAIRSLAILLSLCSGGLSALELRVTDASGKPLRDAVIVWVEPSSGWNASVLQAREDRLSGQAVMDQVKRQFVPFVLPVDVGQDVVFPNSDQVSHHVYSFSKAKRFEIELYANDPVSPVNFSQAGHVVLGCNIHDSMVAYIYVSESPVFALTNKKGYVKFAEDSGSLEFIDIWHPWMGAEVEAKRVSVQALTDLQHTLRLEVTSPKPKKGFKNRFSKFREEKVEEYEEL